MLSYWVEIVMFSLDLATTWWPIPTIILAVLVIFVKASQDNWKSLSEWASSVGIALAIFIVGLLFFYAPYAYNAKLKETNVLPLTELETLRTEKRSFDKTIEELTRERDLATKEKKLFEEARDFIQSELDKVRIELGSFRTQLNDKKAGASEKAQRRAMRDQLARFLEEGEALESQCLEQIQKAPPYPETKEWLARASKYVKHEISSADATQLTHPPLDPLTVLHHYQIPKEHEILLKTLIAHNNVLRNIMANLASGS